MLTHEQQNAAVLDQFSKQAPSYAALILHNPDRSLPLLLESTRPTPDDVVLDVGCGAGRLAVSLAPLVRQVTGIDLTDAMLEQARALQAGAKVANVEWRQGDVTALPFPDGAFSLVTCRSMLHHTVSPAAVVAEMARVCAPGGRIAASDQTPAADKVGALDAIEILRDPSHVHAMSPEELRALGAPLGLREIAVHSQEMRMPLEAVLGASFPPEGMLDRVRAIFRRDAESGANSLGLAARIEDGAVTVGYPATLVVWERP